MAVVSSEHFTDEIGGGWVIQHVLDEGGLRVVLVDPRGHHTHLTPVPPVLPDTRRPVESDAPLPLEIP